VPNTSGIITLMGSGELTATMVEVHKELIGRYGKNACAVFIDTPAGFQLNVDHLSRRASDYFSTRVGHALSIASLKSVQSASALQIEQTYQLLRRADYVLIGPGSPTYALEQWRQTRTPQLLVERIQAGGCLVAASAAALTMGRFTLPVYEIYKVGQPPCWAEGLNLLQRFGFDWAVMPHWNNAEGGNHDTRFCFMGQPRLQALEDQLPETTGILGLDEHTALMIDLAEPEAVIKGIGCVTLRRKGREMVFGKADRIPLALLRGISEWGAPPAPSARVAQPAYDSGSIQTDDVWDPLHAMSEKIQTLIEDDRIEQATGSLLELERHIWDVREQLQERSAMGAAREVLRDMVALIGTRSARRPTDRKACLAPLVEQLLRLRAHFREQQQWTAADHLRDCLNKTGVAVMDTKEGVEWDIEE
jgi:peptidase E